MLLTRRRKKLVIAAPLNHAAIARLARAVRSHSARLLVRSALAFVSRRPKAEASARRTSSARLPRFVPAVVNAGPDQLVS